MQKIFYSIVLLMSVMAHGQTTEIPFQDTKGALEISNGGQATYTLPIALPPSIKNVAPSINLVYTSGVRGGIAGQGWNINSISAISRMSTRVDIDGFRDGVDFDNNDKLALDGQRLLLVTGTGAYWADGSEYETEYKSNTKIKLHIAGDKTYFVVTSPDGSRTWYGSTPTGLENFVSLNSWYIVRFEDVYGTVILYNYENYNYNSTNQLYIKGIYFSANFNQGITPKNRIEFGYNDAKRVEKDFLKGQVVYASKILNNIKVYIGTTLFRKYQLTHTEDTSGYERVTKVQEFNEQGEGANPVMFTYDSTSGGTSRNEMYYNPTFSITDIKLSGDFDGDGRLDFVAGNNAYTNMFNGGSGSYPIGLPFSSDKRTSFTATTLSDASTPFVTGYKLNQKQSLVNANETTNSISFNVYNYNNATIPYSLGFSNSYTKTIPFDNSIFHDVTLQGGYTENGDCVAPIQSNTNEYFEGDFNGDGISEVLISSKLIEKYYFYEGVIWTDQNGYDPDIYGCLTENISEGEEFHLLNLDPRASTTLGESGFVKLSDNNLFKDGKKFIMDFNSDGKSDILIIQPNKSYKVISFKQLSAAPWIELEVLGEGTLQEYTIDKQILFGDYNGDGKVDIMIPEGVDSYNWAIYYSNQNPAGGSFFKRELIGTPVRYKPYDYSSGGGWEDIRNYYALDINKDGKSDIVEAKTTRFKVHYDIRNVDTGRAVAAWVNNIGRGATTCGTPRAVVNYSTLPPSTTYIPDCGSGFSFYSDTGDIYSWTNIWHNVIVSNYRQKNLNTDLIIVDSQAQKIDYFTFNKDFDKDNRLIKVTESLGNIKNEIKYRTMNATDYSFGNPATDFYSSTNSATYPNVEFVKNDHNYLVEKVTATVNNVSKYQRFKYHGFVSNFEYGSVGFTKTARSSWYLDEKDSKIWSIQYNNPLLKGANIKTFSNTDEASVFNNPQPNHLLSSKINTFETYTNPISHQYNVLLTQQITKDELTGVRTETINGYDGIINDPAAFGLKTTETTNTYYGNDLQGVSTATTTYNNNPTGIGNQYYIGRPLSVATSKTIYPNDASRTDTRTASQTYAYNGFNLTHTEKTGHNTVAVHEDMTYDNVGNLLTKTVSVPTVTAGTPAVAPRTIIDEYDPSKRFVIKKTDHQGFVTTYNYNLMGQVLSSVNYLGGVSTIIYDNWGKQTQTTTTGTSQNALVSNITYTKLADGGYTVQTNNLNDNSMSLVQTDVLGRTVKSTTKGFATNTYISKVVEYDTLGHKTRESEPYFSTTVPNRWTTYTYDYLHRPIHIVAPTGRVQDLVYDGLVTTSIDDGKLTTATMDVNGNKIQTTDPGGTINFTYYANGQLKNSDYGGHIISIDIDGWGNKVAMTDPNAGTYTYQYDDFGQSIHETTPKGITHLEYDSFGKLTYKTIEGDGADYKIKYSYNSFSQIVDEESFKSDGSVIDNFHYEYDNYHRPVVSAESNTHFKHLKKINYDNIGRVVNETNDTTDAVSGLSSNTSSKNHYNTYNGMMDKMTDSDNAIIWQLNSANAKMQALTAVLGNGVNITNTYDTNGYYRQQRHTKNDIDIVYNTYDFDGIRGILYNRNNNALNTTPEWFGYDNLDRLIRWTGGAPEILQNITFPTTVEGFVYNGTVATGCGVSNYNQQLKVVAKGFEAGASKTIITNATAGKEINLKFDCTQVAGTADVFVKIEEIDPNNNGFVIQTTDYGIVAINNNLHYTVVNNADIRLTFYINHAFTISQTTTNAPIPPNGGGFTATFYIDNILVTTSVTNTQSYDNRGRIDENNIGKYNYVNDFTAGIYRKKNIDLSEQGNKYYQCHKLQEAEYTMFKTPITITTAEGGGVNFAYNSHLSRMQMNYGHKDDRYTKHKNYTDDGSTEILHDGNKTIIRTFVGGDAYNAPLYIDKTLEKGKITENKYYLHRDYLGTIIAITDGYGTAVERRHFDAWGNLTKLQQNGNEVIIQDDCGILEQYLMMDRGYTSHEQLAEVGLIQMNGRLYDPVIRQFLMPDNFVSFADNTQSYNRYAYVLNNPLLYNDPSGEEPISITTAIIIAATVSALTYTLTAYISGGDFSVQGLCQATFIGAASGAVTFGIGSAATSMFTNFYSQAAFQALAHGTFQGVMTEMNGGSFISGFTAGALSSIASSAWQGGSTHVNSKWFGEFDIKHVGLGAGTGTVGQIAFGTVAGGAGAALTGGNFWQGAVTGLFVSGLNHAMHGIDPPVKENRPFLERKLLDSWVTKNQYFSVEAGTRIGTYVDVSPFRKLLGIRIGEYQQHYESSVKTEYDYNSGGNISRDAGHYFDVSVNVIGGFDYKYNIGEQRFESFSLNGFGCSVEYSHNNKIFVGIDTGISLGIGMGGYFNFKGGWKFDF